MNNDFLDVRCILLCKAFQSDYKIFNEFSSALSEEIKGNVENHIALGEYDGVISFKLDDDKNTLKSIANTNKILSEKIKDSIFYRPLYLTFPKSKEIDSLIDRFWECDYSFFFVTIVHTKHCCVGSEYKDKIRDIVIEKIDKIKDKNPIFSEPRFLYRVYYSLDLSDYVIVWKSNEPYYVLEAIRYIYETTDIIGYTNTISSIPYKNLKELSDYPFQIGKEKFSVEIKAVANSYNQACYVHKRILDAMTNSDSDNVINKEGETEETIESKKTLSYFTFGNEDYLGFFNNITPDIFYRLFTNILKTDKFKDAILSLNTTIAIEGYNETTNNKDFEIDSIEAISSAKKSSEELHDFCVEIKDKIFEFFSENEELINNNQSEFHWQKSVSELLVLLENMSKSAVFDGVCFLFLDSINLFYSFLCYLKKKATSETELRMLFMENELNIETFIKEWDRLSEHVVSIDGTFQRTPGYESLNYNMSASIVEFYNAFTQKIIYYNKCIDDVANENAYLPNLASFVVPKMCRRFKTQQWFFDDRKADSLLFVTIPLSRLYDPFFIITSLTHEISHYCSDALRLRKERLDSFILSVSTLICHKLSLFSNETIIECKKTLTELFKKSDYFSSSNVYYLIDAKAQIKNCVFALLENTDNLKRIYDKYIHDLKSTDENELSNEQKKIILDSHDFALQVCRNSLRMICLPYDKLTSSKSGFVSLYSEIDEIASIYKETYADCMMVYILSLSPIDYIKAAFLDISLFEPNHYIGKLCGKFQRIIIVCDSMINIGIWSKDDFDEIKELTFEDESYNKVYRLFITDFLSWQNDELSNEHSQYYYPDDILKIVSNYLVSCLKKLIMIEKRENNLNSIRKELHDLFESMVFGGKMGIFTDGFLNTIQNNRENILKRWKNKGTNSFKFSVDEVNI